MAAEWANDIHQGDALGLIDNLPADSVHACVTDPPYGLAFMGRDWDDFEPREYQEWCEEWASEVKRVLKPGGHLVAFSGNRTHHRLFVGVEDAGFEIRDTLTWHYGCLSDDTEILTPGGWRSHDEISKGDDVVAFDPDTETYQVEATERVYRYDHDGEMVRFTSPTTDQLVTPNHRVLHFQSGLWQTIYAGRANGIMELPVTHERHIRRAGLQGGDNLREVRRDESIPPRPRGRAELLFPRVLSGMAEGRLRYDGPPSGDSTQRPGSVDRGDGRSRPRKDDWREQPGVERRRDVQASKGELQARDYGPLPAGILADGAGERIRPRTPIEGGSGDRPAADQYRGRSPHRRRQSQQRLREPGTLAEQPASQAGRGRPGSVPVRTTLARTTRVDYSGTVWCVQVPSSYFVARRSGQAFITGNSGFPKALDVSKAIDKAVGAEREVVGPSTLPDGTPHEYNVGYGEGEGYESKDANRKQTEPATDAAREWDGWKTSLKPATEFMVLARKPFDGTVAENVQEHGTGALNIDGCRIGSEELEYETTVNRDGVVGGDNGEKHPATAEGRYPANVIFDEVAAADLDAEVGDTSDGGGHFDEWEPDDDEHLYGNNRSAGPTEYWDSGGPSRYFKVVSADIDTKTLINERTLTVSRCQLCKKPLAKCAGTNSSSTPHSQAESTAPTSATSKPDEPDTTSKPTNADSAGTNSMTGQAPTENTAQPSAKSKPDESGSQSNADTAGKSSPPDQATGENTAQNPAPQKKSTGNTSKQTGTTTTSNESERSSKSDTTTTPNSERRSKHGQKPTENTPKVSPARSVALPTRIGTTTTTINLLTCVGCAEAVTSSTTKTNTAVGVRDSPKRYKYTSKATRAERTLNGRIANSHPTVKPQDLMEWLVRLVTAEGQVVLDPFAGTGTTLRAAKDLNRRFVGIEQQDKWADVARVRCGLTPEDPSHVRPDDNQAGIEAFTDGGDGDGTA